MFEITDALVDEVAAAIHATACGGESWADARIADVDQHRAEARAALAVLVARAKHAKREPQPGEPMWQETLTNDGTHEYTITSDCDGSNVSHWRRTPRRVIDASAWERVESAPV